MSPVVLGLVVGALALSCGEQVVTPFASPVGRAIRPGDTVTIDLAGTDAPAVFWFTPDSLTYLAVYVQAVTGGAEVVVRDAAGGGLFAVASTAAHPELHLLDTRTPVFASGSTPTPDLRGSAWTIYLAR
jgi:hypothetical protein